MEAQANEHLRKKEWSRAADLFNQLLMNKMLSVPQMVSYLLGRSECYLEMGQHESVVSDCRKIIKLLADKGEETNGPKYRARNRLIHALFSLRRFAEAELATREWVAIKEGPNQNIEAMKFLEKLHSALYQNGKHNSVEPQNNNMSPKGGKNMVSCTYCSVSFPDKVQLRGHCQSESHQRVIMSDEGRDWLCRPPPRGMNSDTYSLCEMWMELGTCRYGNQCSEAHGPKELAEWKDRFEYRRMKLQRAYEKELYGKSYTEELLEKWVESTNPEQLMKDKLDYIKDSCCSDLTTSVSSKNSEKEWTFSFITDRQLCAVALLQDTYRNHFEIKSISVCVLEASVNDAFTNIEITNKQEWVRKASANMNSSNNVLEYKVTILFKTDIYGTFRQSVVFDFGSVPVLSRHLVVDVIPINDVEKINEARKEVGILNSERWNSSNANIITYNAPLANAEAASGTNWEKMVLETYPSAQVDNFSLSYATLTEKRLTKTNYKSRMHELLYVEEMARYELVARYNLTAKLRITRSYLLSPSGVGSSTAKYSSSGELFALLNLGKDLSEDTSEGRLVLNSCMSVLLAADQELQENQKPQAYEALIEDKGKNMVYLRLSAEMVKAMNLQSDSEFQAQIQFQLNRIPFCEWHYAIDKVADYKLVFPETFLEPHIPWSPHREWGEKTDHVLNVKQREAIVAITTPLYVPLPPILIIGPFGTGKTYTLAQAIIKLSRQPENRILICTHSNSAADLYIKDYLHPHVEAGHEECRPLRIYYTKRWVSTVHPIVQKYCVVEVNGGVKSFQIPSLEQLVQSRVIVVTLSISMSLSTLNLPKGFFTHIFLDEAAQAMECEAITPLALATENTRIVLAGDHMQLSPEIFSRFAKERNLHVSLLERLYDHYPIQFPCKILLSQNYRAHEAIVNFTSESFYDQKLICSGKQPRHEEYYPLSFFTTRGEDIQDKNSTAFYNNSEVYEIVERVSELKKKWPISWGTFDANSIGIMTPYSDQVFRIRSELRKRNLSNISVERVLNVQGKQFRAIFLSTVRTRRTCTGSKVSGDDLDFGFLSNSKLLNTAITRAQSLVAVVGDPVALCSVGRCCKLWEKFIEICDKNTSLFGITWASLRSQLDGVELKKTYSLNPLAPEFIPRKYQAEAYIRNAQILPSFPLINQNMPPVFQVRYPILRPFIAHPAIPPVQPVESFSGQFLYYSNRPPAPLPLNSVITPRPIHFNPLQPLNVPPEPFIREVDLPSPHMIPDLGTFPPQTLPHSQTGNPIHLPYFNKPPVQQIIPRNDLPFSPLPPPRPNLTPNLNTIHEPQMNGHKPDDKSIQFLKNVHFPESYGTNSLLSEYVALLPQGMTPLDMLTQTQAVQEQWYCYLLRNKGIEAAKKFQHLIQTMGTENRHPHLQNEDLLRHNHRLNQSELIQNSMPLIRDEGGNPLLPILTPHKFPPCQDIFRKDIGPMQPSNNLMNNPSDQQFLNQEINAHFANLSITNADTTIDEMLSQFGMQPKSDVTRLNLLNNIGAADPARNVNNGSQLYRYFS